jgi:hypothetical protein
MGKWENTEFPWMDRDTIQIMTSYCFANNFNFTIKSLTGKNKDVLKECKEIYILEHEDSGSISLILPRLLKARTSTFEQKREHDIRDI